MREKSKAYRLLAEQINATALKKMDGYDPGIMEEIYEEERAAAENLIWNAFNKDKDIELAQFLPKLQLYDGIKALTGALTESKIPSGNSVNIACVLYEFLNHEGYLDVIKQNIDKDPDNIAYVARLCGCKPCKKLYEILSGIYINSNNRTIRSTAVTGILYNKGFITNPYSTNEMMEKIELKRIFLKKDSAARADVIRKLDYGEFDNFK